MPNKSDDRDVAVDDDWNPTKTEQELEDSIAEHNADLARRLAAELETQRAAAEALRTELRITREEGDMVRAELELARTYQAETNDALRLERMSKGPADELLGKSGRRITELEAELAKAVKSTIGQIADALEHKIGDARSVKLAQWIRDERWK